jgi:hypothetical protein
LIPLSRHQVSVSDPDGQHADDFIVLVKSRQAGERVMGSLKRFLERTLKLKINEEKSRVVTTNQATFFGFTLNWERRFRQPSQWLSAVKDHGTCPGRWQRKRA